MVWYPSVEHVIKANKRAVLNGKHRYKLLSSEKAIQSLIVSIKTSESMGLAYQAARFMKEIVLLHAFDGGNHRTAYSIANLFLIENEIMVRTVPKELSYTFTHDVQFRTLTEIQTWILEHMVVT